jgi:transcriptional regulator GlxA family with amidase domain
MPRRLEKARQLLGESVLPIAEIALATGFAETIRLRLMIPPTSQYPNNSRKIGTVTHQHWPYRLRDDLS